MTEQKGFHIESRMPFLGDEWDPCRISNSPPEGHTLQEALRIASAIHAMQSASGPEFQIRVIDSNKTEIVADTNKSKI